MRQNEQEWQVKVKALSTLLAIMYLRYSRISRFGFPNSGNSILGQPDAKVYTLGTSDEIPGLQ